MTDLNIFDFQSNNIRFEKRDNRIWGCLTDMGRATNKKVNDWTRLNSTQEYLESLSSITGFPVTDLLQSIQGGEPDKQGTWAERKVCIRFAQWCSPDFAVQVDVHMETLMTEGSVSLKPMSPAEIIIAQGQILLAIEQKQAELEAKVELQQMAIEANQMETEANTAEIERFRNGHGKIEYSIINNLKKKYNAFIFRNDKILLSVI
jgi:hypothetical protein